MSDPQVRVVARQQLTPELAADASETNRLILIDTEVGHDAGRVYNKKVEPSESPTAPFTHNLNPTTLLTCSKSLYGRCPETHLVSIIGASFEFGHDLSRPVAAAIPEVIRQVLELVARNRPTQVNTIHC
jgi:hydrogenase maturation protease